MKKNNLDEMQDRKLLKLEEYGFWIMFWALAAAIVIQLVTGAAIREVAGELIVLALGSVFIAAGTLKNGLWTRSSTPTVKGNAAAALLPAFLIAVIHVIRMAKTGSFSRDNILVALAFAVGAFVLCFAVLEILRHIYSKRREALDDVYEADEGDILYCSGCQLTFSGRDKCPSCGSRKVRPVRPEDICFLTEAEPIPAGMLQDVLKQHQIPALTSSTVGAGMAMKAGNVFERIKFFVRYEHLEKAKQFAAELFDPADNE